MGISRALACIIVAHFCAKLLVNWMMLVFVVKKKKILGCSTRRHHATGVLSELGFYATYLARLASATAAKKFGIKDSILKMALCRRPRAGTQSSLNFL